MMFSKLSRHGLKPLTRTTSQRTLHSRRRQSSTATNSQGVEVLEQRQVLSASGSLGGVLNPRDAGEPDGLPAFAQDVGTFGDGVEERTFERRLSTGLDIDHYKFELTERTRVRIDLTGISENLAIRLLDADGNRLEFSNRGGSANQLIIRDLDEGNYFLVVGRSAYNAACDYDLKFRFTGLGVRNETQDLGAFAPGSYQVRRYGITGNQADMEDTYQFTVQQPSLVRFGLSSLSRNLNVELRDASGNVLESGEKTGTLVEYFARNLDAGTYSLRVVQAGAFHASAYMLWTGLEVAPAEADPIYLGQFETGQHEITRQGSLPLGDTHDIYNFSLDNSARVRVDLTNMTKSLHMELLDFRGRRITMSAHGPHDELIIRNLDAGNYTIRVFQANRSADSDYDLSVNLNVN